MRAPLLPGVAAGHAVRGKVTGPTVARRVDGAAITVALAPVGTPRIRARSRVLSAHAVAEPPLLGVSARLGKPVPAERGGRAHLGAQARLKRAATGDAPRPLPLARAGIEVPTDTAQAMVRVTSAIEDKGTPRQPPNARAVRRGQVIGTLAARTRKAREPGGRHPPPRVRTGPPKGAPQARGVAVGAPVVLARLDVGAPPARHAPSQPRVEARPGGVVPTGLPHAFARIPRGAVTVPPPPVTCVPVDRQARLRAVVQVEQVAHVLRGETVPVATPRPEETPRGGRPVRGATVSVARLAAPTVTHGAATPPVVPTTRRTSNAQAHAGGGVVGRQKS